MSAALPPAPATNPPADAGSGLQLGAALGRLLPLVALLVFAAGIGLALAVAGDTLGYDFLAYYAAASRTLDGQPTYDTSYEAAGGFGLFYYPPTFVPLVLAFGLLAPDVATWAWIGLLVVALVVGVAVMPVRPSVRWLTLLLAGLSWPVVYAVKLGQVGPLLFLLFALGWRYLDRGPVLGLTGALGAAIKMQPGLILAWALLTRRWVAVATGAVVLAVVALAATLLSGFGSWADFLGLLHQVTDPITTAHNFTPGAVAYQLGVDVGLATAIQWASMALAAVAVVVTALRIGAVPSYLVAVVASQLLSPILWDHYAVVLLLPVAWLVDRGWTWAVLIPLATPWLLVTLLPPILYPAAFWVTLLTATAAGRHTRPGPASIQALVS